MAVVSSGKPVEYLYKARGQNLVCLNECRSQTLRTPDGQTVAHADCTLKGAVTTQRFQSAPSGVDASAWATFSAAVLADRSIPWANLSAEQSRLLTAATSLLSINGVEACDPGSAQPAQPVRGTFGLFADEPKPQEKQWHNYTIGLHSRTVQTNNPTFRYYLNVKISVRYFENGENRWTPTLYYSDVLSRTWVTYTERRPLANGRFLVSPPRYLQGNLHCTNWTTNELTPVDPTDCYEIEPSPYVSTEQRGLYLGLAPGQFYTEFQ